MHAIDPNTTGIIIVDHGSRRADSNLRHERFVADWRERSGHRIVEAAHMELAEPSVGTAFDTCVAARATTVVLAPFFLWPGNHWDRDIPNLAAEASQHHPGVHYLVTAPLGPHPLLMDIVEDRVNTAWRTRSVKPLNARSAQEPSGVYCAETHATREQRVMTDVAIIGAGLASLACAQDLRARPFNASRIV